MKLARRFLADLSPALRAVLVAAAVLHAIGLGWGLPASDGWDNDGIAPRDILSGVASTFTPGDYYTYPPLHLVLLALLTLPITVVVVARAPSTRIPDVIGEILAPSYMTAYALVARVVAVVMALGVAIALARMAEEVDGGEPARAKRAGVLTAAVASGGMIFNYYAHMSNLDMPSLFWGSLAALAFVRALARKEPRRFRHAIVLGALAVATKDQAYALFVVAGPVLLALWLALDAWPRKNVRALGREIGIGVAIGLSLLLLIDGAITNPSGFRARLAFLRGPASQDFSNYAHGLAGVLAIFVDIACAFDRHYPLAFAPLVLGGAAVVLRETPRGRLAVVLAPIAFGLSFTLAFNCAARRTDDRFVLPQMMFLSIYAGIALARVSTLGRGGRLFVGTALALGVWSALRVDLMLLYEPRYETERFLAENVRADDTVEVHGLNAYLPRFPAGAHVIRVGPGAPRRRPLLPGVEEVQAPFAAIEDRRPRFIVVSKCFVWRYLGVEETRQSDGAGRIYPVGQHREGADADATGFFQDLFAERLRYHVVHEAPPFPTWFTPIEIHASLNCRATTFERDAAATVSASRDSAPLVTASP